MFWCVSYSLGAFGTVLLPYETRFKSVRTGAINTKVRATISCCNFSHQTYTIQPNWTLNPFFGVFRSVWGHLESFHYCMKLSAKWTELVQLMQNFVPRSRVGIFHNERTRSTPLYPKLMLWCVSYILDVFLTISLQHETRVGAYQRHHRETAITPADANFGWQYFMYHEYIRKRTEYRCTILPGSIPGCHLYFCREGGE